MTITPELKKSELLNSMNVSVKNTIECKLSIAEEEIPSITFCFARATLDDIQILNGEIRYGGKATFYTMISSGGLKKCEAGVEFSFKQELKNACEGDFFSGDVSVENVKVSSANGIPTATAVLVLSGTLYKKREIEYIKELPEFYSKKNQIESAVLTACDRKTFDLEDEFDIDFTVNEVLWHGENVKIKSVTSGIGAVSIEGEAEVKALVLTDDGKTEFIYREIPFNFEHELKLVMPTLTATSSVKINDSNLKVQVDFAKGKSTVAVLLKVGARTCVYENEGVNFLSDAYSKDCILNIEKTSHQVCKIVGKETIEKAFTVDLAIKLEKNALLTCPLFAKIEESDAFKCENGLSIKGVVRVNALVSVDGNYSVETALVPFEISVNSDCEDYSLIRCDVFNFNVTSCDGGLDVEFKIGASLLKTKVDVCGFVTSITEGKERKKSASAISVFIPCAGDSLWDVAKDLGVSEEEILKTNPELQFPLSGEERIVLYREI